MDKTTEKLYIETRKKYIEGNFSNLNERQREAVLATEGPLLILAGAGSGKTTVLISRIANLIRFGCASDSDEIPEGADEEDIELMREDAPQAEGLAMLRPVEPWRILAITFTNKAAGELKDRLASMLGESAEDIWASTFHSCCVRILRRDAGRIGFPDNFTIYDTADSLTLIKQILKELDLSEKTFAPRAVLAEISRAKDRQTGSAEYLAEARASKDLWHTSIGEVYTEYMKRMFDAGAMDFDDLIAFTVKLLKEHEDVRNYWQNRFRYVMIDEYQDTNNLQFEFASLISGKYNNICVVGDDDQSIYKFRGATIENILSFEDQHPGCRTIRLEQNYRSTGHILGAANAVIRNNTGRKGKELWTRESDGDKLILYSAYNQEEEAQFIAGQILNQVSSGGAWRDHAVLYRMNAQSNSLERAFKRNGIPYRIIGGTRFFDRAEIKDMLAYLNVIQTPCDDLRLTRIINVPARGIGAKTVETVQEIGRREGRSMFDVIERADRYPEIQRSATKLRLFAVMIDELRDFSKDHTPDLLYDELIEKTGYLRSLEEKKTVEDEARAENVKELKSSIIGYMQETGDESLAGFLADVALYTDMDNYDSDANSVVMMTIHSAKGLEFPVVFLTGAEEGIFPGIRSIGEAEEMEEERRLCYVALTRAKKKLYVTCARQRMLFGHTTSNRPSRFIDEIPEENAERVGNFKSSSDEEDSYGNTYTTDDSGYRTRNTRYARSRAMRERPVAAPSASAETPGSDFKVGDAVRHRAFGDGIISSMRPMGNDCLIEIEFEKIGPKKLMLRAASQHMEHRDD